MRCNGPHLWVTKLGAARAFGAPVRIPGGPRGGDGRPHCSDAAPFPILRSDLLSDPDAVYARGEVVTLLYGSPDRVRLLVTEIGHSVLAPELAKKIVAATTNTRFADIPGSTGPGIWIEGAPHIVVLADAPPRLVGNTLVWVQEGRTLRIEGAAELDDALRIAKSMR